MNPQIRNAVIDAMFDTGSRLYDDVPHFDRLGGRERDRVIAERHADAAIAVLERLGALAPAPEAGLLNLRIHGEAGAAGGGTITAYEPDQAPLSPADGDDNSRTAA